MLEVSGAPAIARHSLARARRSLARRLRRARYLRDPFTSRPTGAVTLEDAVASGIASVGRHTYGDVTIYVFPGTPTEVRIGSFCSIGGDVCVMAGGNHRTDWVTTFPLRARWGLPGAFEDGHPAPSMGVAIGSDVWIGDSALLLDGVTVGDGAVIGTRSVVTKDVPPYAIVAGSPAREIGSRFSEEQVTSLLAIRWWEWPDEVVRERVSDLCGGEIDAFIASYGEGESGL